MVTNNEKYKEARLLMLKYLYDVAKAKNISIETIADKTGFSPNNVSRMLKGRYSPSLDNFMRIAEAIGTYFFIIDKDMDDKLTKMMKERWEKINEN